MKSIALKFKVKALAAAVALLTFSLSSCRTASPGDEPNPLYGPKPTEYKQESGIQNYAKKEIKSIEQVIKVKQ